MAEARMFTGVEISIKRGEDKEESDYTIATVKLYPYVEKVKVKRTASHEELLKKIEEAVFKLYPRRNDQF